MQFRSAGFTHLQLPGVEDIARGNVVMVFSGKRPAMTVVNLFTCRD